ncbi:hypothetical protein DIPPA_13589 [Diplonema papillatum]|nr:hypothetical protein DIPPA_13589 [Diplonema papillatum]
MVVGEFRLEWKALFEKRGVVRWCHTVDKMNRTWSRNRRVAVLTDTGLFLMKGRTMSRALPLSWISIVEADQVAPQLGFRVESEHGLVLDFLSYPRKKEFLAEIKDAYFAKMQAPIAVEVLSTNRPLRGYLNVSRKPRWDVNRGAAETLLLHRNSVFVFPRLDALKSPDAAPGESPDEEDRIDGLFLNGEDPRYADNSFNRSPVDPLPDAFPHPDALGSPSNANRSPRSSPARSPRPEPAVLSPLEYVGNSVRSLHSAQRTGLSPAAAGESPRFPVLLSPAAHAAAESPRGSVLHSPTHAALRSPHASFSPRHPPLGSPLRSVVRSPRHRSFEPEALSRHSSLPAADEGFEPRAAAGYVPSGVVSFRGDSVVLVQHPPDLVSAGNSPHLPPAAAGGRGAGVAAAAQQQQQQQHLVSVAANSHALRMKGASLMSPRRPVGPEPDGFAWAAPAGRGAAVHPGLRLQPQPAGRAGLGRGQPFYSSHERQPSAYSFQVVVV